MKVDSYDCTLGDADEILEFKVTLEDGRVIRLNNVSSKILSLFIEKFNGLTEEDIYNEILVENI